MTDVFTGLSSWRTTDLQGGNVVVPVQEFGVYTIPGPDRWYDPNSALGVYFQFRRALSQLAKLSTADRNALISSIGDQLATRIEEVMAKPNVVWMAYSQPTNAGGHLLDTLTIFVQSDSGDSSTTVDVPLANIGPGQYTSSRIDAAVDALNAAEGL